MVSPTPSAAAVRASQRESMAAAGAGDVSAPLTADIATDLSPPLYSPGTPSGVREAGIDTARLLYRIRSRRDQAMALDAFARPRDLGPLKAGYIEGFELLWVEGRPSTLADADTHALLPAGALPDAQEGIRAMVRSELPSAVEVGVTRVDATATVSFGRSPDGWATMRGIAAMHPPRREISERFDSKGRPLTIGLHYPRAARLLERVYDKGVESGTALAGTLIRFEAQTRHPSRERTTASHWTMERTMETFESRFRGMAAAAEGFHVRTEAGVREQLRQLVEQGAVTPLRAEQLLGHLAAESVGIPRGRRTVQRRRADLRRLGLGLAMDGYECLGGQDLDVDLGAVLDDVLTSEKWRS